MLNLKNGGFLLGLLAGIALTALLGIFVFTLVQAARPAQPAAPQPAASATPTGPAVTPTDMPADTPTPIPEAASTDTPTGTPTEEAPTGTPTEAPTDPTLTGEPTVQAIGAPKTGQTQCWDADGNLIDCAGTGQDGEYQKGIDPPVVRTDLGPAVSNLPPWSGVRFVDNGDGTVTDNATGLIWLKNANCFGGSPWQAALNSANTLASPSCGLSDGSVAGDWRLPNVNEMQSLIDPTQANPPLPAGYPFADVQIEYYWTSTTIPNQVTNAWLVGMQWNGFVTGSGVKAIGAWNKFVWPVRGGQ